MSEVNASSSAEKGEGGRPIGRAVTPGGHPLDQTQPAFPVYHRRFANPAPLGLMAFATTTLLLSLFNVHTNHIDIPDVVIGLAFAYGGLAQLLAGMWEFAAGNTFGATAFSSYGAFWLSFGYLIAPWSGTSTAFANQSEFAHAVGLYLFCWMIVTFILLIASLRSSVGLISVFFFLTITFLLLGVSYYFPNKPHIGTAGGAFGIVTAFAAYYTAVTGLLTPDTSYFVLPVGEFKHD